MANLVTSNTMYVLTSNGEREIQLCLGDITRLPVEDKVDLILISANPNDYAAIRSTVIGALKYSLNIDVRNLSIHGKKEDLRSKFNCWISKPLPESKPYRQLLCFELALKKVLKEKFDLRKSVQGIFRALMPAFNNENKSVITSLLATGGQGERKSDMLSALVDAAVEWMKMGLPLQRLKIVMYVRDINRIDQSQQDCIKMFSKLSQKYSKSSVLYVEIPIKYDLFIAYSNADTEWANKLRQLAKKYNKSVKIADLSFVKGKEESWQHHVYETMSACARIVPVLSESYLKDTQCVDMYNLALCCNRRLKRRILAPVCMEQFQVPLYMGMVQWVNCKLWDEDKMEAAMSDQVEQIQRGGNTNSRREYDVFISYSHRNITQAKIFLNTLSKLNSKLKIFFDYDELKTGVSWQQTLYRSLDSSKCVITLLSPEYFQSQVCQEELSLAMAKHFAKNKELELISVNLTDDDLPEHLSNIHTNQLGSLSIEELADHVCGDITTWLDSGERTSAMSPVEEPIDVQEVSEQFRMEYFANNYTIQDGGFVLKEESPNMNIKDKSLYISYTTSDSIFVDCIVTQLKEEGVQVYTSMDRKAAEFQQTCNCTLLVLSKTYFRSEVALDELQLAISAQRAHKKDVYVVQLNTLPEFPLYPHLIHCDTAAWDEIWYKEHEGLNIKDVERLMISKGHKPSVHIPGQKAGNKNKHYQTCVLKVICDLRSVLAQGKYIKDNPKNDVFVNVVTLYNHYMELSAESRAQDRGVRDDGDSEHEDGGHTGNNDGVDMAVSDTGQSNDQGQGKDVAKQSHDNTRSKSKGESSGKEDDCKQSRDEDEKSRDTSREQVTGGDKSNEEPTVHDTKEKKSKSCSLL